MQRNETVKEVDRDSTSIRFDNADDLLRDVLAVGSRVREGRRSQEVNETRGWISPEGKFHDFGDDIMQTHGRWAAKAGGDGTIPDPVVSRSGDGWMTASNMMYDGWVRKDSDSKFHVSDEEHIPTATAHAREHAPHLSHVEVVVGRYPDDCLKTPQVVSTREKKEESATPYSPPVDKMQRGFIAPDGTAHHFDGIEMHHRWASRNCAAGGLIDSSLHGYKPGDGSISGHRTVNNMLQAGWVRVAGANYHVSDDKHIPKAISHARKYYPNVDSIEVTKGKYPDNINDPSRTVRVPRLPGTQNEEEGNGHEERGWIHPNNRYHPLGNVGTHGQWARDNEDKVERATPHAIGNTPLDTAYGMLRHGWIRKTYTNQYHIGSHADIPRVMRHIQKHHPEHKRVHVIVGASLENNAEHYRFPVESQKASQGRLLIGEYLAKHKVTHTIEPLNQADTHSLKAWESRADQCIREHMQKPLPPTDEFLKLNKRHHAWITPQDHHIPLGANDHHDRWVQRRLYKRDGGGRPQPSDKLARYFRDNPIGIEPRKISANMVAGGWIRKYSHDDYTVANRDHIHRALKHVDRVHPSINKVTINVQSFTSTQPRASERLDLKVTRNQDGSWPDHSAKTEMFDNPGVSVLARTAERAWISPKGEVHDLGDWGRTHMGKARDLLKSGKLSGISTKKNTSEIDGISLVNSMLQSGWVRKEQSDLYHVSHADHMSTAVAHARERHDHKNIRISVGPFAGERTRINANVHESHGFNTDNNFNQSDRAWISPEGKVHAIGLNTHNGWVEQASRNNPTLLPVKKHRSGTFNNGATQIAMRAAGWIQKHSPYNYEVNRRKHLVAVRKHSREYHPKIDLKHVDVFSDEGEKLMGESHEPTADSLIQAVLNEVAKRHPSYPWLKTTGGQRAHMDKHAPVVHDDASSTVYRVETVQAHRILCGGTKLCTNNEEKFNEYKSKGPLYVIRDKVGHDRSQQSTWGPGTLILHHPSTDETRTQDNKDVSTHNQFSSWSLHRALNGKRNPTLAHHLNPAFKAAQQDYTAVLEAAPTTIPTTTENPKWIKRREHAWISPSGEYHKLKPHEHHADQTGELGGVSYGDIQPMLKVGWIRKVDQAIYHVHGNADNPHGSEYTQHVFDHVSSRHPDVNRISINYGNHLNMRFFSKSKSTGAFELEPKEAPAPTSNIATGTNLKGKIASGRPA